jgi:tripartite-type tricarboxylate transporter receptor subunit TctC
VKGCAVFVTTNVLPGRNVINATGGAGVTGHTRGALARPDGYTLTTITPELAMMHWRGLTNITFRDFEPLVLVNRDSAALFVRNDAPWRTVGELQQQIREQPGKLKASFTASISCFSWPPWSWSPWAFWRSRRAPT